ncbi:hypothetical protein [Amycolatopsis sp. SID8362]|uniref:hypothetical protein n=1 Tax=Amycolatopsis sp. SID8362 TaxID=2690346 RepID=UPI0013685303|nr:hypothetical protein [Amycolatopsis sp. SID8362]NBH11801.1 hypothetical protein [Amycolatopsis sp. SID8362]NED48493.1 hypothetical protein [Amycolatopsis sp. SID8362]
MPAPIVVASDGSALAAPRSALMPLLRRHEAVISAAGLPTRLVVLPCTDDHRARMALRELPPRSVVFLPHVTPRRESIARHPSSRLAVLTGQEARAVALTAALMTGLRRRGRSPRNSRIVIVGGETIPLLPPLLLALDIDVVCFPPCPDADVSSYADVIVDMRVGVRRSPAADRGGPVVLAPAGDMRYLMTAVPGLLRAVGRFPGMRFTHEAFRACVHALVTATPPARLLPAPSPRLADHISDAVCGEILQRAIPHQRPSAPLR